jgi:hypothetical protein
MGRDQSYTFHAFGYTFHAAFTEKQFKRLSKSKSSNSWVTEGAKATVHFLSREECIVCLDANNSYSLFAIHGLLVHEAVHVWQQMKMEIRESNCGLEIEAYHIQCIAQNLMWWYDEHKNKTQRSR